MIGRVDLLRGATRRSRAHWKAADRPGSLGPAGCCPSRRATPHGEGSRHCRTRSDHGAGTTRIDHRADAGSCEQSWAIEADPAALRRAAPADPQHRTATVGTMLSGAAVSRKHGLDGAAGQHHARDPLQRLGAGQSFGAFVRARDHPRPSTGDSNDYFGQGPLGRAPDRRTRTRGSSTFDAGVEHRSSATSRSTARPAARPSSAGMAGERFCGAQQRRAARSSRASATTAAST